MAVIVTSLHIQAFTCTSSARRRPSVRPDNNQIADARE
jgi:hypothetical protein